MKTTQTELKALINLYPKTYSLKELQAVIWAETTEYVSIQFIEENREN